MKYIKFYKSSVLFCIMLIFPMLCFSQVKIEKKHKVFPSIYKTGEKVFKPKITNKIIELVIDISEAQLNGDLYKVTVLMNKGRINLIQYEMLLNTIFLALIEENISDAENFFSRTKSDVYIFKDLKTGINRKEIKGFRDKMNESISLSYKNIGGFPKFKEEQKNIIVYKKSLWNIFWFLYTGSTDKKY